MLAVAAVVLGGRKALAPTRDTRGLVQAAMALLKQDPSAWRAETRSAIRAASVLVEQGADKSAEGYYLLALQYVREHNAGGAEALFKRAIAARPDWSWPYVGLGNLLGGNMLGRTEEAVTALNKAAQRDPAWSRPHDSLAIILRTVGRFEEAEKEALRAIELDPHNVATLTNYANLLIAMGRMDEAREYYLKAMAIDPEHPKPYYNLACLYSIEGNPAEAVRYLEQAIRLATSLRVEARNDPDFDAIRDSEAFRRLVYVEEFRSDKGPAAPSDTTGLEYDLPAPVRDDIAGQATKRGDQVRP